MDELHETGKKSEEIDNKEESDCSLGNGEDLAGKTRGRRKTKGAQGGSA